MSLRKPLLIRTVPIFGKARPRGPATLARYPEDVISQACDLINQTASGERTFNPHALANVPLDTLRSALQNLMQRVRDSISASEHAALTDAATGLPNRNSFRRRVEAIISDPDIPEASGILICLDFYGFKRVRDQFGHTQVDQLLRMIGARLTLVAELFIDEYPSFKYPLIARLTDDVFAIFLTGPTPLQEAVGFAKRTLQLLEQPLEFGYGSVTIQASAGLACAPEHSRDYDTLMHMADLAMHDAKAHGRSQVRLFDPELIKQVKSRALLECQLRRALAEGELVFAFQPQLLLHLDEVPSAEALIRWQHPERGLLPPGIFIPVAEESGLIVELGRWVLTEGMRTVKRWERQGTPCRLSINLTARDFDAADIIDFLRATLARTGANPDLLEIEITESLLMGHDPAFIERLIEIRSLGIRLAIDDFGTGYSNLSRLLTLPIDRLKIDRSLIADIGSKHDHRAIVQAFISLAKGLGYDVVAEGVETLEQIELLKAMGCDVLQGFMIAPPMAEADFLSWLENARGLAEKNLNLQLCETRRSANPNAAAIGL